MSTEVAPGVLVVETSVAEGKVGVIAGDRIALAVDAGIDDAEGQAVLEAARSLERPTIWLAYTHGHVDHALGGTAFRGQEIIASPDIAVHMAAQLEAWAERNHESPASLESRLAWPTIMFEAGGGLDLGGRQVHLIDAPGHAPGTLCLFAPDAGVLFGGDTVVTGIPPYFKDGNGTVMETTLRDLAALDARILVPGHGDVIHGADAVRAAITWEADYLQRCREHVLERRGADPVTILAEAPYDVFIGDRLPRERHQMEWRHEQAVRLMIEQSDQVATA